MIDDGTRSHPEYTIHEALREAPGFDEGTQHGGTFTVLKNAVRRAQKYANADGHTYAVVETRYRQHCGVRHGRDQVVIAVCKDQFGGI
jgi:hypothetical protein